MNIEINHCNNIENGIIEIEENQLNIKYAINGTGKSTISMAINYKTQELNGSDGQLKTLKPFKYLDREDKNPDVKGIDSIKTVKTFDEDYINEFVFTPDELIKGSFDIFIRDEKYDKRIAEIDNLVEDIKRMFSENKDIDDLINNFNELSNSFGKPTKSGIHGASGLSKAFKKGNKVENIPNELLDYKEYIRHSDNFKWVKWQIDGKNYLDIAESCPYCISNITKKKETIKKISEVYDPKVIQYLNTIVAVFDRLNQYFSDETKNVISDFLRNIDGYSEDQVRYLKEIKDQIDRLNLKFNRAKNIGFKSLKEVDKVIEELNAHKIDLKYYPHLNSVETQKKADIVNNSIDRILLKAGDLQGIINKQKLHIETLISENKIEINGFLKNAGYEYYVDILEDDHNKYNLKLIHNDIPSEIDDVRSHLSFGERNAFSLVLFMYDALKNKPNLIILDDPISSFDKNKKYAIIDMLFHRNKSLKGKTVLLLTHDFEPIIDMVHHHRDRFEIPKANFLENSHGRLTEKPIGRENIKSFIEINKENINDHDNPIHKLVYLRRLQEITQNKGPGFQLLSNLMHKRDNPIFKEMTEERPMTRTEISEAEDEIKKYIPDFNYKNILSELKDDLKMKKTFQNTNSNYEKLHIYRIIFDDKESKVSSNIILKFINEAFHIENDYIYQLNPREYQMVPQFVIDECEKLVNAI